MQAEELLSKASMDCHSDAFHCFATGLHSTLQSKFPVQEMRSKTKQTRLIENLWGRFHHARLLELPALWEELRAKLCCESSYTMLQQHANETLFQNMLANYLDTILVQEVQAQSPLYKLQKLQITHDEDNIIHYTSGYVPYKLLKRFSCQGSDKAVEYVECLSHMSVSGSDDFCGYATTWLEQKNRGGLFPLNDQAYQLYTRCIELKFEWLSKEYCLQHFPVNT